MRIASISNEAALRSAGLLFLRVVVGAIFLVHGLDKLIDLSAAEAYFRSLDIPLPGFTALFVGLTEAVGGALLIAGLITRVVGLALAGDMLVALLTEHIGDGFFANEGGIEFVLVLVLGSAGFALALTGAGRFSIDSAFDVTRRLLALAGRFTGRVPRPVPGNQLKGTS